MFLDLWFDKGTLTLTGFLSGSTTFWGITNASPQKDSGILIDREEPTDLNGTQESAQSIDKAHLRRHKTSPSGQWLFFS
jgi:hypothetical protein